jgi:hypothetical protein
MIDFLVIGAQKAGTTWIDHVLRQHPAIFLPETKEVHFFDKRANFAKGADWYLSHFRRAQPGQILGEATPNYFWNCNSDNDEADPEHAFGIPAAVARMFPGIKLVSSLRDPVDRAVSAYFHHIYTGRISPRSSILDHAHRFGIFSMGLYACSLRAWFDHFDPAKNLILIYEEDIKPDAAKQRTAAHLFKHLGVAPFEIPSLFEAMNRRKGYLAMRLVSPIPRGFPYRRELALSIGRRTPNRIDDWFAFTVSEDDRARLGDMFRPSVRDLEQLLGRELPWAR